MKQSQPEQAIRGRTIRFTMKRPGTYSSSSVTSSPKRRSLPPHWAQAVLPGVNSTSMRGIWSGIGLRFGLSAGVSSGRRSLAVIAAMAISLISSASCNCSAVSDEAPNRWARWPANWCRNFSIWIAWDFTSASKSAVNARSSAGSSGSDLVTSSMAGS